MSTKRLIEKIVLEQIASFKEAQPADLRQYNFFYGLNGSGKTTISRLLEKYPSHEDDNEYKSCRVHPAAGAGSSLEIMVYNKEFIEKHFYSSSEQRGIFTLDKINKNAANRIVQATKKREKLVDELTNCQEKKKELSILRQNSEAEAATDFFEYKQIYEKTSLVECLHGFRNDKKKFMQNLINSTSSNIEIADIDTRIEELKHDYAELSSNNLQEKTLLRIIENSLEEIEKDSIWNEIIVASSESYLSDIIERLGHSDWITTGIEKYLPETEDCPFCARPLGKELKKQIQEHIDFAHKRKLNAIEQNASSYKRNSLTLLTIIDENLGIAGEQEEFKRKCEEIKRDIGQNEKSIEQKRNSASQQIELIQTNTIVKELNTLIEEINKGRSWFNERLKNATAAKSQIRKEFWSLLRKKESGSIAKFKSDESRYDSEIASSDKAIKKIYELIDEQGDIIKVAQGETLNIEAAIKWINNKLQLWAFGDFRIETAESDEGVPCYKIKREGISDNDYVFPSLSEGEKTLIAFLYFVKLCAGTTNPRNLIANENRVIVIDDPISSLSFNHIFDVACLIKDIFLSDKSYGQIIILTHHLYFLHEMLRYDKSNNCSAMFRIYKGADKQSIIETMEKKAIQNTYTAYWQTIKDVKKGKTSCVVLPNIMRNILEYYFGFIHKDGWRSAIEKLMANSENSSFDGLLRYLNKESHSDSINFSDVREIEPEKFLFCFEKIFETTGFHEHYKKMMGTDD